MTEADRPFIEIGERIARLRFFLGYKTQADFARFLGVAANLLSMMETGLRRPTSDFALLLQSRTGADMHWLYTGSTANMPLRFQPMLDTAAPERARRGRPSKSQ
ncbi:transcriptional regulator with XRE-family HTH domain [Angulomicrobium tetraedrale]|uniref:Transcriptional regulator with XRE-family HTH domain n=1 Tax=Ancylobacter tetraedralis TaxID=217068 RepID=A0A839Z9S1_9HYPH|nr:helix-turn-helix transcriptional regulator [Ancylobacter tetraedralis]MBB3771483.1 transcriptional regulator with XRE-family HTH domain [Ancylobacter tetraedralis]